MKYREWLKGRHSENIHPCRAYNSDYNIAVRYMTELIGPLKADAYEKGQLAERERIKAIIKAVKEETDTHFAWEFCCEEIMEKIDDI